MQRKNIKILDEKYKILSKLGSGGTSNVFLCESLSDKKIYAAKILKKNNINRHNQRNKFFI